MHRTHSNHARLRYPTSDHRLSSVDELRALTESELRETLLEDDLGLLADDVDTFVAGLRDWSLLSTLQQRPSPPTSGAELQADLA